MKVEVTELVGEYQTLVDVENPKQGFGNYGSLSDHVELDRHIPTSQLLGLLSYSCLYGGLVSSMGIQILPREMERMFEAEHAVALGASIGVCGLSQLVSPIAGYLSDKCSSSYGRRRPFLVWSSVVSAFLLVGMWFCRTHLFGVMYIVLLFFAMIGLNIGYAAFSGLMHDLVPSSQLNVASGIMGAFMMSASALSLAGVGWWITIGQSYFYFLGTLVVTVTLTAWCSPEIPIADEGPTDLSSLWKTFQISHETHGDFYYVFVSRTMYYAAVSVQTFLYFYCRDVIHLHEAKKYTAILCLIAQVTAGGVSFAVGSLSASVGRKNLIYIACAIITLVYIGYIMARSFLAVCILASLYGVGNGTYIAVDYALARDTLPDPATAARDLGLWGIAAFLGIMIGPVLCGPLLMYAGKTNDPDHYSLQGYTFLMLFGAVFSVISAIVVTRIKSQK